MNTNQDKQDTKVSAPRSDEGKEPSKTPTSSTDIRDRQPPEIQADQSKQPEQPMKH